MSENKVNKYGKISEYIFKRTVTLDSKMDVIIANKEFFGYFESADLRCHQFFNFVIEDEKEAFLRFVLEEESEWGKGKLFHLKRNTGEYRVNSVKVIKTSNDENRGTLYHLETVDICDAVYFNERATVDEAKIRLLMGMTDEYAFSYSRADNLFRLLHYDGLQRVIVYRMDIDDWKFEMVQNGYIPESEEPKLDLLISELKSYSSNVDIQINCGIRTQSSKAMENLCFRGVFFDTDNDRDKAVIGRVLTVESNNRINEANDLMVELHKDPLTGVYNKKTITEYATQKLLEERDDQVILVIMDVDHFKMVNDTYGHMYGDQVLARVGAILKSVVAEDGVVGRFGGDEFMLVLTRINDVQVMRGLLRTIRDQIKMEFSKDFGGLSITCSMGAAISPKSGKTFEELFSKADFCLYVSKEKGRDRYVYFREELHTEDYAEFKSKKDTNAKNDGREMKELRYMAQFGQQVLVDKDGAIKTLMEHMISAYKLDNITVYMGEDLKCKIVEGTPLQNADDALYVKSDMFTKLMKDRIYVKMDFVNNLSFDEKDFGDEMCKRGVGSTLQCVIGNPSDIKGVLTLNRMTSAAKWAEYEVNCAVMLAAYLTALSK